MSEATDKTTPRPTTRISDADAGEHWQGHAAVQRAHYSQLTARMTAAILDCRIADGSEEGTKSSVEVRDLPDFSELQTEHARGVMAFIGLCKERHLSPRVSYEISELYLKRVQQELVKHDNVEENTASFKTFISQEAQDAPDRFLGALKNEARIYSAIYDPIVITNTAGMKDAEPHTPTPFRNHETLNLGSEDWLRGKRVLENIQRPICDHPIVQAMPDEAVPKAMELIHDIAFSRTRAAESNIFDPSVNIHSNASALLIYNALEVMSDWCQEGRTDYDTMVKNLGPESAWYKGRTSKLFVDPNSHIGSQGARYALSGTLGDERGVVTDDRIAAL